MFPSFFQIKTSAQVIPITVTEICCVKTLRGLSSAPVNLVTREMARSVNVNISVPRSSYSLHFSNNWLVKHIKWSLSYELELACSTIKLKRGDSVHRQIVIWYFFISRLINRNHFSSECMKQHSRSSPGNHSMYIVAIICFERDCKFHWLTELCKALLFCFQYSNC